MARRTPVQLRKKLKLEICEYSLGHFALSNAQKKPFQAQHSPIKCKSSIVPGNFSTDARLFSAQSILTLPMGARYSILRDVMWELNLSGCPAWVPVGLTCLLNFILPVKAPAINFGRFSFFSSSFM